MINSKKKITKNWMTKGLLTSARRKNELPNNLLKHPNNVNLQNYYIKYKNKLTSITRETKIRFKKKNFFYYH